MARASQNVGFGVEWRPVLFEFVMELVLHGTEGGRERVRSEGRLRSLVQKSGATTRTL